MDKGTRDLRVHAGFDDVVNANVETEQNEQEHQERDSKFCAGKELHSQ